MNKKYRVIKRNKLFYPQEKILGLIWVHYFNHNIYRSDRVYFIEQEKAIEFCSKQIIEDKLPKSDNIVWKSYE